jgi:peptide-methionine (R)-S-oxide reductase
MTTRLSLWTLITLLLARIGSAFPSFVPNSRLRVIQPLDVTTRTKHLICLHRNVIPVIINKGTGIQSFKNGLADNDSSHDILVDVQRRRIWTKSIVQFASVAVGISSLVILSRPVWASSTSRTTGYEIQKSEAEWKEILSPIQYYVLREGGTERPGYSILEKEKRSGIFKCAACSTQLFRSVDKFNSGTGWPSFARGLPGVEIENVNPITASLSGVELRCKTCGGHLGDVFRDGFLFQGTEAAVTGQRFCIDGAALVFYPTLPDTDLGNESYLRGDIPAKNGSPTLPSFLDPPTIKTRDDVST